MVRMKAHLKQILLSGIALLCITQVTFSGDERLNYQGRLAKGNSPVSGTLPMIFQIYDGKDGANVLYEESMNVTVVDGYYSIELGEFPTFGNVLSSIKHSNAYMQVTVEGKKLTPREKVGRIPFARNSTEKWTHFNWGRGTRDHAQYETNIANKTHWKNLGYDLQNHIQQIVLNGATYKQRANLLFPPSQDSKQVLEVKIFAVTANVTGSNAVAQAVVRRFNDDRIERTLTDPVRLEDMLSTTWFDLPLNKPTEEATISPTEYLCLELTVPAGDESPELRLEDVFVNILVQ